MIADDVTHTLRFKLIAEDRRARDPETRLWDALAGFLSQNDSTFSDLLTFSPGANHPECPEVRAVSAILTDFLSKTIPPTRMDESTRTDIIRAIVRGEFGWAAEKYTGLMRTGDWGRLGTVIITYTIWQKHFPNIQNHIDRFLNPIADVAQCCIRGCPLRSRDPLVRLFNRTMAPVDGDRGKFNARIFALIDELDKTFTALRGELLRG